jgi:hypothetical protein
MLPHHTCTPGRVSWVHFTHENVHKRLEGKPPGYFMSSGSGDAVE